MAENKKRKKVKPKTPFMVRFAYFMIFVLAALFYPSTVLFCGGMMPTLVAAIVEDEKEKTAWMTVGAMNFLGLVPTWFTLWEQGHRLDQALYLLTDVGNLLVIYGAAAVGWLMYYQIPILVSSVMSRQGDKRQKEIITRQKELIRKWGEGVTGQ